MINELLTFHPSRETVVYAAPCGADRALCHEAAWELLRLLLRREWNLDPDTLTVLRRENGKPVFREEGAPHFSLTHTDGYAAAVISSRPVGIDLEKLRPISDRVAWRFLDVHPAITSGLPGPFSRVLAWTRLESYGKITGRGFTERDFSHPHQFSTYYNIPGHLLTVCEFH